MTSNIIYTPYFYIIQHIESKKLYAGSRYASGCHPDEFMQPNGYQTSSNTIKSIIEQEGLLSFSILRIDTYCDNIHPYDYESLFLQHLDCAKSPNWYNGHNNDGISYRTEYYDAIMIKKYGDKNYNNPEKANQTKENKSDIEKLSTSIMKSKRAKETWAKKTKEEKKISKEKEKRTKENKSKEELLLSKVKFDKSISDRSEDDKKYLHDKFSKAQITRFANEDYNVKKLRYEKSAYTRSLSPIIICENCITEFKYQKNYDKHIFGCNLITLFLPEIVPYFDHFM